MKQRIVCLAPDTVEILYSLGLGDSIVGWSAYTDEPPEVRLRKGWQPYTETALEPITALDAARELNREVAVVSRYFDCRKDIIEALQPILVLGSGRGQEKMTRELAESGLNAYCFSPSSLKEVFGAIRAIGNLTGTLDRSAELIRKQQAALNRIRKKTDSLPPAKVYFEVAHRRDCGEYGICGPYTCGGGTPLTDMLLIAGGVNVFDDLPGEYREISFEQVVCRDPDVILTPIWPGAGPDEVTSPAEIMNRPGFSETGAVKNGRVYYYDSSLMKRFGPRTFIAVKKLAYLLHPQEFTNPKGSGIPWELGRLV